MTREEFIDKNMSIAIHLVDTLAPQGYRKKFIELLEEYESKKEHTETHIVDSSKFNNAQFNEDCKYGEVDPRQYGLDPELLKLKWEEIINNTDKLRDFIKEYEKNIHKYGLSPNGVKTFCEEYGLTKEDISNFTKTEKVIIKEVSTDLDELELKQKPYRELLDQLNKWIEECTEIIDDSKKNGFETIEMTSDAMRHAYKVVKQFILKNNAI